MNRRWVGFTVAVVGGAMVYWSGHAINTQRRLTRQLAVTQTMLTRLQLVAGFQRLRTSPLPGGFRFDLSGFTASNVVDHSHSSGPSFPPHLKPPSFEARVGLAPRPVVLIPFQANLGGAQVGEACIFHLIQSSVTDVVEGGLTLAMVRV